MCVGRLSAAAAVSAACGPGFSAAGCWGWCWSPPVPSSPGSAGLFRSFREKRLGLLGIFTGALSFHGSVMTRATAAANMAAITFVLSPGRNRRCCGPHAPGDRLQLLDLRGLEPLALLCLFWRLPMASKRPLISEKPAVALGWEPLVHPLSPSFLAARGLLLQPPDRVGQTGSQSSRIWGRTSDGRFCPRARRKPGKRPVCLA